MRSGCGFLLPGFLAVPAAVRFQSLVSLLTIKAEGTTELQAVAALVPCQDFARCNLLAAALSEHCS